MKANKNRSLFDFATQLVEDPAQLEIYDRAKWSLLGHAQKDLRFEGQHPWLTRVDREGIERAYTVPVFSGFSPETQSVIVVRKDNWTHHLDPATWLVAEQNLETGKYVEPLILSVSVDAANQFWLQMAPGNYTDWPDGYHPSLHAPAYDQLRIEGRVDENYHTENIQYKDGTRGEAIRYQDLEALEQKIIEVQLQKQAEDETRIRRLHDRHLHIALGGIAQKSA